MGLVNKRYSSREIEKVLTGIIASCQPKEPYGDAALMAREINAKVFRVEGEKNCRAVRSLRKQAQIIGLIKTRFANGLNCITREEDYPALSDVCNFVAVDATGRNGYWFRDYSHNFIGDVATMRQAIKAMDNGCCAVTTALSGYTGDYLVQSRFDPPSIYLVSEIVKCGIPVIAEGRYFSRKSINDAFSCGAMAVCIGAALLDPKTMYDYFSGGICG